MFAPGNRTARSHKSGTPTSVPASVALRADARTPSTSLTPDLVLAAAPKKQSVAVLFTSGTTRPATASAKADTTLRCPGSSKTKPAGACALGPCGACPTSTSTPSLASASATRPSSAALLTFSTMRLVAATARLNVLLPTSSTPVDATVSVLCRLL